MFILNISKSPLTFPQFFQTKTIKKLQQTSVDQLNRLVKTVTGEKIPKEIILRAKNGNLVSTLIKESKKGGYEFIIVDKSNEKYNGALTQTEISTFISKSHCPVLTINKNVEIHKIQNIIVPIDISQTVRKRLFWATLFAKKFNSKIEIVSVLNVDIEETKSLAYKNAEKIRSMLLDRGLKCDVTILKAHSQSSQKAILDYVDKKHPEMVIIRTHQENRFSGKKIGKFVSEIIHGCKIPVFAVGGSTEDHPLDFK